MAGNELTTACGVVIKRRGAMERILRSTMPEDAYRSCTSSYRPRRLTPEEQERKQYMRQNGIYDESNTLMLPQAMRELKEREAGLAAAVLGKPWLVSGPNGKPFPTILGPDNRYIAFTPARIQRDGSLYCPGLQDFINFGKVYVEDTGVDIADRACCQQWLQQAEFLLKGEVTKQINREISNENLQDTREESSALRQEWAEKAVTKTVNFASGLLTRLAEYRNGESRATFAVGDLNLSQKQEQAVSLRSAATDYDYRKHRLPKWGDESEQFAVLNAWLFNRERWEALALLIEEANAPKNYTDVDGIVRSITTNKKAKDFDPDQFNK